MNVRVDVYCRDTFDSAFKRRGGVAGLGWAGRVKVFQKSFCFAVPPYFDSHRALCIFCTTW